jgi:hypothetical protein
VNYFPNDGSVQEETKSASKGGLLSFARKGTTIK